jgi:C-terminal processing protease CtpA/Prc
MRQLWSGSLSPKGVCISAAALALLFMTARAPAQSREDSSGDESAASADSDRDSDRASSDSSQTATDDRRDENGQAANRRSTRRSQTSRGSQAANPGHHAKLGVTFYNDDANALEIRRVMPGSAAEEAGLRRGDEILSVNGRRVSSVQQLKQRMDRAGEDQEIELGVLRNGRQQTIEATLTSGRGTAATNQRRPRNEQYGSGGGNGRRSQWSRNQRSRGQGDAQGFGNQGYADQNYESLNQDPSSQSSQRYAEGYRGGPRGADHAFLGIALDDDSRNGVRVANIFPDSPAEHAGLRPGDEIVAIDDQDVQSNQDVQQIMSEKDIDDDVSLDVDRNGRERNLTATLMSQQEYVSQSNRDSYRTGRRDNRQRYNGGGNDQRNDRRRQDEGQDEEDDD